MTSNIGADLLLQGGSSDDVKEKVELRLRSFFRPELLNRINEIVHFNALTPKALRGIARNILGDIEKRLKDKYITLNVTDRACDFIVSAAYTNDFGARPLSRYIEKNVVTAVSKMLFSGVLPTNSTVNVEVVNGEANDDQYTFIYSDQRKELSEDNVTHTKNPTSKSFLKFSVANDFAKIETTNIILARPEQ